MVPREWFNRMAILALVAILLSGALTIRAFAVDDFLQDGEAAIETSALEEDPPEAAPEDPAGDEPPEAAPEDPAGENLPEADPEGPAEEEPPEVDPENPAEEEPPEIDPEDPKELVVSVSPELLAEVSAIRQSLELILYGIIPCLAACILVYKFCMWFYYCFLGSEL